MGRNKIGKPKLRVPLCPVAFPTQDKQAILDSLVGITVHDPVSLAEAKRERLSRQ
jgi:hypothetical protein